MSKEVAKVVPEVVMMGRLDRALASMPADQRARVLAWLVGKHGTSARTEVTMSNGHTANVPN